MEQQVLQLYKNLLRYGQNLKYTDTLFFQSRIREIFRRNQNLTDEAGIKFQVEKGLKFLQERRVI